MAFFDNISRAIETAGNKTKQKTKDITGAAKINSMIAEEERALKETYQRIGKEYVARHSEDAEEAFRMMVEAAKNSENKISEYRKKIQVIRNVAICPNCAQEVPAMAKFCLNCGSPMPEITPDQPICPKCGSPLKPNVRFCTCCGERIEQQPADTEDFETKQDAQGVETIPKERLCPNCGSVLAEGAGFCIHCGASVETFTGNQPDVIKTTADLPEMTSISSGESTEKQVPSVICRNCGREIPEGIKYCTYCGTAVDQQQETSESHAGTCPVCGAVLDEDSAFCDQCGSRIS